MNAVCDVNRELICHEKLKFFAMDIYRHSKLLKERLPEIKLISTRLDILSKKLAVLENLSDEETNLYSSDCVQQIIGLILSEQNIQLHKAHKMIDELIESFEELNEIYRHLTASSYNLEISPQSKLLLGNVKQKPLEYYLEKATIIILYIDVFQKYLKERTSAIALRKSTSYQEFAQSLHLSKDFLDHLDEFEMFSKFLRSK